MNLSLIPSNDNQPLTMSSREIAELTGKEHKNVLADIRKMLDELGLMSADFSAHIQVPGPNGGFRTSPVFNLPKDLTITLVSGYSVQMRHRIVTRWMELEKAPEALPDELTRRRGWSCVCRVRPPAPVFLRANGGDQQGTERATTGPPARASAGMKSRKLPLFHLPDTLLDHRKTLVFVIRQPLLNCLQVHDGAVEVATVCGLVCEHV